MSLPNSNFRRNNMNGQDAHRFSEKLLGYIKTGQNPRANAMLTPALARESNAFGTLLHYAATHENTVVARQLICLGADVNQPGVDGLTPLMLAVERRHLETIELLLQAGASMEIVNATGRTAMQMVLDRDSVRILRMFQDKIRQDSLEVKDLVARLQNSGSTMHEAIYFENLRLLQSMLDAGMDVNAPGFFELTALHAAVEKNDTDLAKWLVVRGANVNARDKDGFTPLLLSVVAPLKKDMLRLLLEHGADPNIGTFDSEESPLYALVIFEGSTIDVEQCIVLLFKHGAIPRSLDSEPDTIFDKALNSVSPKRAKYLIGRVVLLEKAGEQIDETVMRCNLQSNQQELKKLADNYRRVLDELVFQKLTLFDLMSASSDRKLRKCARHRWFVPSIREFCKRKGLRRLYPYYWDVLRNRVDESVAAVKLEDDAIPIVCELFGSRSDVLYVVARLIVEYLGRKDLNQLREMSNVM